MGLLTNRQRWQHPMQHLLAGARRDLLLTTTVLVVDFEMTCGPGITQNIQDIVELGYCVLEAGRPVALGDSSSIYIRPTRSPVTAFCTKLTGITPERVEHEPTFVERHPAMSALVCGVDAWLSWGPDEQILNRQCAALGLESPFAAVPHFNLKPLLTPLVYAITGGTKPKGAGAGVGLATAAAEMGLDLIGQMHSAAMDAFNAARLYEKVRERLG